MIKLLGIYNGCDGAEAMRLEVAEMTQECVVAALNEAGYDVDPSDEDQEIEVEESCVQIYFHESGHELTLNIE